MVRSALGLLLLAAFALGCSSDDDDTVPDTAPPAAPTTPVSTTTTTTEPGPPESPLADEVASVEVSARLLDDADESLLSIEVGRATLESIESAGPSDAPAWCTGASGNLGAGTYLVRIGPPAVDSATGGIERFEIGTSQRVVAAGPVPAALEVVVDGRTLTSDDATLDLLDDLQSGTFRGVSVDGVVIEGAFRCS
jgi:hypothetical protein